MKHKQEKLGEMWIFVSLGFQAAVPVGLHYGASVMPQVQFLAWVTLLSGVMFLPVALWFGGVGKAFSRAVLGRLLAYTMLIAVVPYGVITYATKYSSAVETALLTQAEVVFAMIFGWLVMQEKMSTMKLLGAGLILMGNVFLLWGGELGFSWANFAIGASTLLFVFGNIIAKNLQRDGVHWSLILAFRNLVGGIILLAVAGMLEDFQAVSSENILFIVVFSLLFFGLGKVFWQLALHRLDLSKVTALGLSAPVVSIFIAFLWLGEVPSKHEWLSILVMALGVLCLLKTKSRQWAEAQEV